MASSIPDSKESLQLAITTAWEKLLADYQSIPPNQTRIQGVDGHIKGTQISVCDTAAYLIGWGQLVLKWQDRTSKGLEVDFPETGYKWNQLGLLATSFHQQYQAWSYDQLIQELEHTTQHILTLIDSLSNDDLYQSPWYKKWTLGRMIQLNTSSPMKNMRAKIRRFKRTHIS